jgi:hypothetical protein
MKLFLTSKILWTCQDAIILFILDKYVKLFKQKVKTHVEIQKLTHEKIQYHAFFLCFLKKPTKSFELCP